MSSSNTESIRECYQGVEPNLLFLALNKPHKPVTSASIARWIKELLTEAGVDTDKFSAHSTRAAASSSAKAAGLSPAEIMKMVRLEFH